MSWADAATLVALGSAAVDAVLIALLARPDQPDAASGTRFGLPLGAGLPPFTGTAVDMTRVTDADARGRLLLFVGNACHSCHPLVADLATLDARERSGLLIIVVDRAPAAGADLADALTFMPRSQVMLDPVREIADRMAMPGVPFLYAIDLSGRVRAKSAISSAVLVRSLSKYSNL